MIPAIAAVLAGVSAFFAIDKFVKPTAAGAANNAAAAIANPTPSAAATAAAAASGVSAQTLADPIQLANLVDKLPDSAVDPRLTAALAANQGPAGFTAVAQLANATADVLAQAQAAALAAPSAANNALVVQAAINNAAATAAEDQSGLDANGNPLPSTSGIESSYLPNFARRFRDALSNHPHANYS